MLHIKDLSVYLKTDLRLIIDNLNLSIKNKEKLALVGEEGNGKSTLLKAIYNIDSLKNYAEITGSINKNTEVISYLEQTLSYKDLLLSTEKYLFDSSSEDFFDYNLYYELIRDLGFNEKLIKKDVLLKNLSGGERIKFLLLTCLMKRPSILLLDEPSNDLDIAGLVWLENFINKSNLTIIYVSHDIELLKNTATSILLFEQLNKRRVSKITYYGVGYIEFKSRYINEFNKLTSLSINEKKRLGNKEEKARKVYQKVKHAQQTISRADPAGAKNLKDKMHVVKAHNKLLEKERKNLTKKPDKEESLNIIFPDIYYPVSKEVINISILKLYAGDNLLSENIHLTINGPKKVAITGSNGVGKTTLLKEIIKELDKKHVNYGYMPQIYLDELNIDTSVVDYLSSSYTKSEHTKIISYLASLNFNLEETAHSLLSLSGGQKAKVFFVKMLLMSPSILLLDEPTRNLSSKSNTAIKEALKLFKGPVIFISHDREFTDYICTDKYILKKTGLYLV